MTRRYLRVPASHLREDIRKARRMVKELQHGIKRDEKELKMAKRKPKHSKYGSPPEEHRERAGAAAHIARHYAAGVNKALQAGQCFNAFRLLTRFEYVTGRMYSESMGAGGRRHAAFSTAERLEKKFKNVCLKGKR